MNQDADLPRKASTYNVLDVDKRIPVQQQRNEVRMTGFEGKEETGTSILLRSNVSASQCTSLCPVS